MCRAPHLDIPEWNGRSCSPHWGRFFGPIPRCDEMSDDADRFRKQAEEARQQAEKAISPLDKEAWLRVAVEWLKLAQSVEDRRDKR